MEVAVEKLTKAYIKIREKRAELSASFKDEDAKLADKMNTIKRALLDHCEEHSVESVRTTEGLFYRTVKQRYWTNDREQMHQFIMEHKVPELSEKRLNQTHMRQFLEEHPDVLPKGLNVDSEYAISVRKK